MKEIRAIFPISSILVIRFGYAKKDHFSNIRCISIYMGFTKIWVADLNSQRKNYPMKEFQANIFYFIDFGQKRSIFNISCNSKYMGFT